MSEQQRYQFGRGRGRFSAEVGGGDGRGGEEKGEEKGEGARRRLEGLRLTEGGEGGGGEEEKMRGQAVVAKSEQGKGERAVLAVRPDDGGSLGRPRQMKVNFFPVKISDSTTFHLYSLVVAPCRWREWEAGERADAKPPPPLTPLEKHEVLAALRERAGQDGYLEWNNDVFEVVYDGNAMLATKRAIPWLEEALKKWEPSSGRPVPAFHFGAPPEAGANLDEDCRGRELSLNRFTLQLSNCSRPLKFRASISPVLAKSGKNLFNLSEMTQPHSQMAQCEYRLTCDKVYDAVFSQWCMNWASQQRELWHGKRPSQALANPYAAGRDPEFKIRLPNGMEVWYGLYFKCRIGRLDGVNCAWVNLDTSQGVMYTEQTFLDYAAQLLGGLPAGQPYPQSFTASQAVTINRHCAGIKVRATHNRHASNRTYVVKAFRNDQTPHATRFAWNKQDGGEISVADYFLEQYKHAIQFPHMGMVEVKTPRDNQVTFLPPEVLEIAKKQDAKTLPENAASIMIKKLCTPAPERESRIMRLAEMARFGGDPWSKAFNMVLTPKMHVLKGRVLPPPPISFGKGKSAVIKDGVWQLGPMLQPASIEERSVIIFSFSRIHPQIGKIASDAWESLRRQAAALNIPVAPNIYLFNQNLSYDYDTIVKQICGAVSEARDAEKKISLIVVVMKERNPQLYSAVKYVGDHFLGIPSQCLLLKTISPLKSMTAANVLIKINAKLGGANWGMRVEASPGGSLAFLTAPSLVMGVEVSHPKLGDARMPSIASVVANTDRDLVRWNATIAVSKPEHENIPYFRYAFEKRMFEFVKKSKKVPRHIFLYRDGVSESQYEAVMAEELKEVQDSIKKMFAETPFTPKLTFIISIKRHQVRLFPNNRAEAVGKSQNVAPGSVVDVDIASPDEFDFWLMSHFGIQGTCRPTYYQVLYDENNLSSDQVQLMSYWLCHAYARCPRAVSYPAPTYYAHLAAERARYHLVAEHTSREDSKLSSTSSDHDIDTGSRARAGGHPSTYTPTATYTSDALSSAARGSSSSSTSTSSSSSSSSPVVEEAGVKTPEDVYKGVSSNLHRLQLAVTVSSAYYRNDNLYFA